jgi:hypothetical protein
LLILEMTLVIWSRWRLSPLEEAERHHAAALQSLSLMVWRSKHAIDPPL